MPAITRPAYYLILAFCMGGDKLQRLAYHFMMMERDDEDELWYPDPLLVPPVESPLWHSHEGS